MPKIKLRIDQYFSIFFCLLLLLLQGCLSTQKQQFDQFQQQFITLLQSTTQPSLTSSASASLVDLDRSESQIASIAAATSAVDSSSNFLNDISATAYLALDVESAAILLDKNLGAQLYPASTVKLMTALVARDVFDLNQVVAVQNGLYTDGHRVGFSYGQQFLVRDLVAAILVNSGNDAAMVLANYHPQGYDGFVQAMNEKAKTLNLKHTVFKNPTGLDEYSQVSSAWDLSILAREAIKDPFFKQLAQLPQMVVTDISGQYNYTLFNTNKLLAQHREVKGLKTGTTPLAGEVLISLWEVKAQPVLIIVMQSDDRYQDTLKIYRWLQTYVVWQSS